MKTLLVVFFRAVLVAVSIMMPLLTLAARAAQSDELLEYALGSGDTVSINVYGEEDLSLEAKLGDAGTLNYPFLGKLKVAGKTVQELQQEIVSGLKGDYLIEPKVSVNILEYRQFFINGEVTVPGGFPFQPGLTVAKAVTLAQGFTERANKKGIYIISENDSSRKSRKVRLSSEVKPGDIITVKESFF